MAKVVRVDCRQGPIVTGSDDGRGEELLEEPAEAVPIESDRCVAVSERLCDEQEPEEEGLSDLKAVAVALSQADRRVHEETVPLVEHDGPSRIEER